MPPFKTQQTLDDFRFIALIELELRIDMAQSRRSQTEYGDPEDKADRDRPRHPEQEFIMNYQRFFEDAIDQLHAERRYRVFAD
ncbi:hypothetical protein, partial [Mesorhizobium sp. B2-4-16]|uniref:hypothetical protein n=1 Tax=Mesorhizobium sp. B2-4-16 TaxID=2589933 RepID=UPI0011265A8A